MKFDIEKIKGKVIHCNTEEKANKLLEFLNEHEYNWNGNKYESLKSVNFFQICGKDTCYRVFKDYKKITYDSLKYFIDKEWEILKFEDVIIPDKPKICEITGLEVGEKFNIKGYLSNPCTITKTGNILDCEEKNPHTVIILNIIQNPDLIEKIPEWTDKQKEVFKTLKEILNIKYIIRNKSGMILGCQNQPTKYSDRWEILGKFINLGESADNIFDFIEYESEPFEIQNII